MQDFFLDSLVFGAKSVFVFLLFVLTVFVSVWATVKAVKGGSGSGGKDIENGRISDDTELVNLTKEYAKIRSSVASKVFSKEENAKLAEQEKKKEKQRKADQEGQERRHRLFVLDFDGDLNASQAKNLGLQIDALLSVVDPADEVMVRVTSPGGTVTGYGLAASQLSRIRSRGIRLTVCVDKIAASGGYMMACVADCIIAAPFAIVGSIGVVSEFPNFHRLLEKLDVDYEQETAGDFKRTLSIFGDNSDPRLREKFRQDLETCHALFKSHICKYRPQVKIDEVATGEYWHAQDGIRHHLVDEIGTSNEFIASKLDFADIFEFRCKKKTGLKGLLQTFSTALYQAAHRML